MTHEEWLQERLNRREQNIRDLQWKLYVAETKIEELYESLKEVIEFVPCSYLAPDPITSADEVAAFYKAKIALENTYGERRG